MSGLSWRFALRLFRARSDGFVSLMAAVSLLGIVLGVAALCVVLSVMNGFNAALTERILGVVPHVLIHLDDDTERAALTRGLRAMPEVLGVAPLRVGQALLQSPARTQVARLDGVDPDSEAEVSRIPGTIVDGDFDALGPGGIVLGAPLAGWLGVGVGDRITLVVPEQGDNAQVVPRLRVHRVVALFEVGAEPDFGLALVHLDDLESDAPAALRLRLADVLAAPEFARRLIARPGFEGLTVDSWASTHGSLFATVRLEKQLMFAMVFLIVVIGAFAIVSAQVLLVDEKRGEIAILRVMGASRGQVAAAFFMHALMLGLAGITIGLAVGVVMSLRISGIVAWVEAALGTRVLAGTYFEVLPSVILVQDLVAIALLALLLVVVAGLLPVRRVASRIPWETLRHA